MMFSLFSCGYCPLVYLVGRNVYSNVLPIFNWIILFLVVELWEFFIYFGNNSLIRCMIYKYFLPLSWLSFHFLIVSLETGEGFLFLFLFFNHNEALGHS